MATETRIPSPARIYAHTGSQGVPWYVWACAAAVLSGAVGGGWDVSWHESIGRDTFWTPAHMAIYLSGVLAGGTCAYLILRTTFRGSPEARAAAVRMWGFRGPLGAFLCVWGGAAMLASAPFDNWWHGAYGLDVKILSPPHVLLIAGLLVIRIGALLLVIGEMSRAGGGLRRRLDWLAVFILSLLLAGILGSLQELMLRNYMHSARFYILAAAAVPPVMAVTTRVSPWRWSNTATAGLYMAYNLALVWILPLFPAEPKLGPVHFPITHFVPPGFPLLLIFPALLVDLLRPRLDHRPFRVQAAAAGALFLGGFAAFQWPFAAFLMSPASRNRFFATVNYPFFLSPASDWARNAFTRVEPSAGQFWTGMGVALVLAVAAARAGLGVGEWMRSVRR